MSNYHKKYIKYKNKYLNLYKQLAGEIKFYNQDGIDKKQKYYTNDFMFFLSIVKKTPIHNLKMLIGYDVADSADTSRDLDFDIALNKYSDDSYINDYLSTATESDISKYILDFDFNQKIYLFREKHIRESINTCKFEKIIFDSFTFKFIENIHLLIILYYTLLQQNGSIYIESNQVSYQTAFIDNNNISNELTLMDEIKKHKEQCFFIPVKLNVNTIIQRLGDKSAYLESLILKDEEIYEKNITYLYSFLIGSEIKLINSCDIQYPILHKHNPIIKYYKITKIESVENIQKKLDDDIILKQIQKPVTCYQFSK